MKLFRKIFNRLTLRCAGAVVFGVVLTAAIAVGIVVYTGAENPETIAASAPLIDFPDSDAKLDALARDMGQDFDDIAPAAGGSGR